MRTDVSDRARSVIAQARGLRSGVLTITLGNGCCESTAPFLYEDYLPGPGHAVVGSIDGVDVLAPEYLRDLYPGDEAVTIDVIDELAESFSIETEFGCRLVLRGARTDSTTEPEVCAVDPEVVRLQPVSGQLPEALRRLQRRPVGSDRRGD